MLVALEQKQFTLILNTLPATIKDALKCPPVKELLNHGAKINDLEACLAIEITRTASMLSVGGNLKQGQSLEIAGALIREFPNESLQDFCLCLKRGLLGKYMIDGKSDIYRFDILVICNWMKAYLEEKYQVVEDELMNEKESSHFVLPEKKIDSEEHQKWLDKLKEAVKPMEKNKIPSLPQEIIDETGEENYRAPAKTRGYAYFNVRGVMIYAGSQEDAERIAEIALKNGDLEEY